MLDGGVAAGDGDDQADGQGDGRDGECGAGAAGFDLGESELGDDHGMPAWSLQ